MAVNDGIRSSRYLLVALSRAALSSRWVKEELSAGLMRQINEGGTFVLPAFLEDCQVPPLLAHRLYMDFRGDFDAGLEELVSLLDQGRRVRTEVEMELRPVQDDHGGTACVYLHSTRFDRCLALKCDLSWTASRALDRIIEGCDLPYQRSEPALGMQWSFSYSLIADGRALGLTETLEDLGVSDGETLQLRINARWEDLFEAELHEMEAELHEMKDKMFMMTADVMSRWTYLESAYSVRPRLAVL